MLRRVVLFGNTPHARTPKRPAACCSSVVQFTSRHIYSAAGRIRPTCMRRQRYRHPSSSEARGLLTHSIRLRTQIRIPQQLADLPTNCTANETLRAPTTAWS